MSTNAPPYDQNYVSGANHELLQRMEQTWREASPYWQQFQAEADIDTQMVAGNLDAHQAYGFGGRTNQFWQRGQFNVNKLLPAVNMIAGHQIRTRKSSVIIPQEPDDQRGADQLSGLLLWAMNRDKTYDKISECFEADLISGMCLLYHWLDFSRDPINGDIRTSVMKYSSFLLDPFIKKADFSDCRYIWTRKWLSRDNVKLLLPGREDEIDSIRNDGNNDGRFQYLPEAVNYQERNLLIYDEYWYRTTREQTMLLDNDTGETHKWRGTKDELELFMISYPQVSKIKQQVSTINYGIAINNRAMLDGPNPLNIDRYPFAPFFCYFFPEIPYMPQKIQGIVRNARDLQWSYSRRHRLKLDYLEAGIQRGYIYPENVPVDPDNLYEQGNGVNIPIKAGADPNLLRDIPPPQIPPSWFQMDEQLSADMMEVLGPTEELMGMSDSSDVGITEILKQGAGLTRLMPIFNRVDVGQNISAQIFVDLIQANWENGKMERILNEEIDPDIVNRYFSKFDIQIIDGTMTPTQQWMEFRQIYDMIQKQILPTTPAVLQVLFKTAPLQNKQDLITAIEQYAQQEQEQQQQAQQQQQQVMQAEMRSVNAQATANEGLGVERLSRVKENQALAEERRAEAIKDLNSAALDQMKAVKELQGIDFANLEKFLAIIKGLKADSQKVLDEAKQEIDLPTV